MISIIVGIIAVIVILALGYFGYIPAIASLFGTNKPKDLGVKYTTADLASAKNKFGVEIAVSSSKDPSSSMKYEGSHPVSTSFTDEELTAMVASENYIYQPVKNVQIKIGENGALESSGTLIVSNLTNYFLALTPGVVDNSITKYIGLLPSEVPYYISGTASVSDGSVSMELNDIQIGAGSFFNNIIPKAYANSVEANVATFVVGPYTIPGSTLSSYQPQINTFLSTRLNRVPGLQAKSITFSAGKMNYEGTMPNKTIRAVQ